MALNVPIVNMSTQRMVGNDDSPSIGMFVDAVATAHPLQRKPIGLQRSNKSPSL